MSCSLFSRQIQRRKPPCSCYKSWEQSDAKSSIKDFREVLCLKIELRGKTEALARNSRRLSKAKESRSEALWKEWVKERVPTVGRKPGSQCHPTPNRQHRVGGRAGSRPLKGNLTGKYAQLGPLGRHPGGGDCHQEKNLLWRWERLEGPQMSRKNKDCSNRVNFQ